MSRSSPYLHKAPENFASDIEEMRSTSLFLVSKSGPTVFVIKTDNPAQKPFKVFIGSNQRCTCGGGEATGKLCKHILFVMNKVLRVPETNPLCWQLSLIDSEITNILAGKFNATTTSQRHAFLRRGARDMRSSSPDSNGSATDSNPSKTRQELVPDEVCPICQDEMTSEQLSENEICFCEQSCGNNIHVKCLLMYATHMKSEVSKASKFFCEPELKQKLASPRNLAKLMKLTTARQN